MGKRTKQYKKLMRAFELLGFRQPYQLLMTSDVLLDTVKLDLITLFEKTLSTKGLKPMITQCCIRALYAKNAGPNRDPADEDLRDRLRSVVPTPLMYVKRSVVILEPMSSHSAQAREREERAKFMDGIIRQPQKRKREEKDSDEEGSGSEGEDEVEAGAKDKPKKKKQYGRKGANPLSVKKSKKKSELDQKPRKAAGPSTEGSTETKAKRKRRKKATGTEGGGVEHADQTEQVHAAPVERAEA
ncbi:hypothetical protein NEMBOFW57_002280 [Staphylotrichum longicolle]|uniref:UTP23 sensor motif region domain-containing protein n=1 Tax=Staphylotrichum longicolle TaxID=669026 RepID=A0AAD4I3G8_9PEZI|nr:hypothetical protein NEMBOFW57_002280 [Staphylotrichum longicolle]